MPKRFEFCGVTDTRGRHLREIEPACSRPPEGFVLVPANAAGVAAAHSSASQGSSKGDANATRAPSSEGSSNSGATADRPPSSGERAGDAADGLGSGADAQVERRALLADGRNMYSQCAPWPQALYQTLKPWRPAAASPAALLGHAHMYGRSCLSCAACMPALLQGSDFTPLQFCPTLPALPTF